MRPSDNPTARNRQSCCDGKTSEPIRPRESASLSLRAWDSPCRNRLLEPERIAPVFIIARISAEFLVAALSVAGNRRMVGGMDFEADRPAMPRPRDVFCGGEKP